MEQNEEEHGGSCGLRITGTSPEFWILFKYGRSHFKILSKRTSGQSCVLMGSILLPSEKCIIEGQGWTQRD